MANGHTLHPFQVFDPYMRPKGWRIRLKADQGIQVTRPELFESLEQAQAFIDAQEQKA